MSMKSSTPARRAASMPAGSTELPVASTGSVDQSRLSRWWSWPAASVPWSGEKSMKTAAGPSKVMRSSIDLASRLSVTTDPSRLSASVSQVMRAPSFDANR